MDIGVLVRETRARSGSKPTSVHTNLILMTLKTYKAKPKQNHPFPPLARREQSFEEQILLLEHRFSACGSWSSSTASITWELVTEANSLIPPFPLNQAIRGHPARKPRLSWNSLKLEKT